MGCLRTRFATPEGARSWGRRALLALVIASAVVASGCSTNTAVTTSPTQAKCQVTLAAVSPALGPDGGLGTIAVTTTPECPWSASAAATWLSELSPASGQGTGSIQFSAAANLQPSLREGEIIVNDSRVRVSQQPAACRFALTPASLAVDAAGSTGEMALSATSGCSWALATDVPWISFTTASTGSGDGTLGIRIAPNANGAPRSGTISAANQRTTITQAGVVTTPACAYAVSPPTQSVAAAGSPGLPVSVTVANGCTWTASSTAAWLIVTAGASGAGNGAVAFTVAANPAGVRIGTIAVANQMVTVTQSAAGSPPCSYTLGATAASLAAAGGMGSVSVSAGSGCTWSAGSNASWITVTSAASASGSGAVAFSVAANTGPARTGPITVAGQTFTVTQAAAAVTCTYSINPTGGTATALGGPGAFDVSTGSGCTWTVTSTATWIAVTSGARGTGNGAVAFLAAPNPGGGRTGTITVAGRTFTVTQAALLCIYTLGSSSVTLPEKAGTSSIGVSASTGCAWTARSNENWISVTSGTSGNGNGTVTFSVTTSTGKNGRTGTMTIAGQVFTVTQRDP